ncbi:hypothetical protein FYK55_23675 [Roseiconus nitratireducens]|uniref:Uncharacterized protein n=1 Tax=Roseiconus nitratireducens TaxID=2605748 RepID=A0A5M6CWH6_9BACT|nr:hypothetical protein [Roseiconus nitratireducens]KAA5539577.1 hypothetical protein FYK55_23675 [Roseiconus nitratireducens]
MDDIQVETELSPLMRRLGINPTIAGKATSDGNPENRIDVLEICFEGMVASGKTQPMLNVFSNASDRDELVRMLTDHPEIRFERERRS